VNRAIREQLNILAEFGVKIERERPAKGGHRLLYCCTPKGIRFVLTVQASQSCTRGFKNFRALVKRLTDA
jgi:hypothetical protein